MKKARICFVGAGKMANIVHYPSIALCPDVEIVGICDLDERKLHETAATYGIKQTFTDYKIMMDTLAPDGVFVIAPPQYAFDIVAWFVRQGIPVFCEKPLGLNLHQTYMLAELAEQGNAITQVGHQRRSSPLMNSLLDACKESGPVTHAVCEFYKYDMQPLFTAQDHIHDDCSHSVDTLRHICNGEVTEIESHVKHIGTPDINWVQATLGFDNGSTGILVNSWASGRRVFRVEIHAPGVYADVELEQEGILYKQGDYHGVHFNAKEIAGGEELFLYGGFRKKHREFIDSIQQGKEMTSSPFRDVAKTMTVVERILAQSLLTI